MKKGENAVKIARALLVSLTVLFARPTLSVMPLRYAAAYSREREREPTLTSRKKLIARGWSELDRSLVRCLCGWADARFVAGAPERDRERRVGKRAMSVQWSLSMPLTGAIGFRGESQFCAFSESTGKLIFISKINASWPSSIYRHIGMLLMKRLRH